MIRSTIDDRRPRWLYAAIAALALAACGGKESEPAPVVQSGPSSTQSAPVIPAGSPVTSGEPAAPATTSARFEDGETLYKEGRFAEAKAVFTAYVETRPENAFGHYMLGLSSWKSGDLLTAERAFARAIETDPTHVKSLFNSARVLMDLDRNAEALERIQIARTIDSTSAEGVRLLARAQHRLGKVEEAVSAYRLALTGDERDVWAMNNLGMLYLEQKNPQEALGPLARAVQLRPTSPIFQNNLGMTLELLGDVSGAKQGYLNALKADSTYAKAKANSERLGDVVVDPASAAAIDVTGAAEVFRQQVKMWKEAVSPPVKS